MGLSKDEFNNFLRQLYPTHGDRVCFEIFRCSRSKELESIGHQDELYNSRGVVFLRILVSEFSLGQMTVTNKNILVAKILNSG